MKGVSDIQRRFLEKQRKLLAQYYPNITPPTIDSYLDNIAALRKDREKQLASGAHPELIKRKLAELDAVEARAKQKSAEHIELEMLNPYHDRYALFISQIREAAIGMGYDKQVKLIAGTMPTGKIGACLLPSHSETDEVRYVLLDDGFPLLANLVAKALVQCLPIVDTGDPRNVTYDFRLEAVETYIKSNIEPFAKDYNQVLATYSVDGNVAGTPRKFIDPRSEPLARFWLETIEKFLLAHEYAHVLNGKRPKSPDGDALAEWDIKRTDEFEADNLGFRLLVKDAEKQGLAVSEIVAPVCAFFDMCHDLDFMLLGLLKGSVEDGEAAYRTYFSTASEAKQPHPEWSERMIEIVNVALGMPNGDYRSIERKLQTVSMIVGKFRGLRDVLINSAAKHGVKLHPKFGRQFEFLVQ